MTREDLRPHLWVPVPWSGCWEWLGYCSEKERARIMFAGKARNAARVFYQHYIGAIPDEMFVCHTCDNGRCVNPAHMFLGSNADNMRDMARKNRHHNQKKTHCVNGHEFTKENTYVNWKGNRNCRECQRKINNKYGKTIRAIRRENLGVANA